MTRTPEKLAILVGGDPAPGISSGISSASIRAVLKGVEIVGILDGFNWLYQDHNGKPLKLKVSESNLFYEQVSKQNTPVPEEISKNHDSSFETKSSIKN